jgi:hypothetical protein
MGGVDAVLRALNWLETWTFRILGALVREVTALLTRILRRGRFRPWRRGT